MCYLTERINGSHLKKVKSEYETGHLHARLGWAWCPRHDRNAVSLPRPGLGHHSQQRLPRTVEKGRGSSCGGEAAPWTWRGFSGEARDSVACAQGRGGGGGKLALGPVS